MLPWAEIQRWLRVPLHLSTALELHVLRHGETVTSARELVSGTLDVNLTSTGIEQARAAAGILEPHYDIAISSRLRRSRETLEHALALGRIRVGTILEDGRLNERCLGVIEGKPAREVPAYASGDFDYAPEGGDTYREVTRRVLSFLIHLVRWAEERHARRALISTHMGPMRIIAGVLTRRVDPVDVLAASFLHAELLKLRVADLEYPHFLGGGSSCPFRKSTPTPAIGRFRSST